MSLSADGKTAIVGGRNDNTSTGAAWVWARSGGVWTQAGTKLVGSGASATAAQGNSVSLSADGNTAIVGGPYDNYDAAANNAGAVWIWARSGGVWTQQGTKLVGSGAVGTALQGNSVSLSADGNTAIVGGPNDNYDLGANSAGAVWVWTRSGGAWTQQGTKLVGLGAVGGAGQGYSASLSADGNTAIVGGFGDNNNAGAVWVWTRSGGVWTQQGTKLVGSGASATAQQGYSVSLSADGNTAIVGGSFDNVGIGAAWVWTRSGGAWTQQGTKLVGSGASATAHQGSSVSLSADGNTAIVGGNADNSDAGAAWVWTRSGGVWTQQGTKLVGSGAVGDAQQGISVFVSGDGNTAIVGGSGDNSNAGAAWVFAASAPAGPAITTQPQNQSVTAGANANFTVAASGTPTPTLQWRVSTNGGSTFTDLTNTAPYSGVTSATLTVTSTPLSLNGAQYRAVATNGVGTPATSNAATLTVTVATAAPVITTQPQNKSVTAGANATFTVAASGTPTPTLQWRVSTNGASTFTDLTNAAPYSGVTSGTLTVTAAPLSLNGAQYRAVATNGVGTPATSNAATLTVTVATPALSITTTTLPSATVGTGYGQGLAASGGQAPYTWSVSSGLPPGLASNATVGSIFGTPTAGGTFTFTVTARDNSSPQQTASRVLSIAVATATSAPVITTQPSNRIVTVGANAAFTVASSGTPAPTLQWQVSTNAGTTWSNLTNTSPYSGVTSATLTVTATPLSLNGSQYRSVATNGVGTPATSNAATLTVTSALTLPPRLTVRSLDGSAIVKPRGERKALAVGCVHNSVLVACSGTLALALEPGDGPDGHLKATHPSWSARPLGSLQRTASVPGQTVTFTTEAGKELNVYYNSPEVSGRIHVTATCSVANCYGADLALEVRVPSLVPMNSLLVSVYNTPKHASGGQGSTCSTPVSYGDHLSSDARKRLESVAERYGQKLCSQAMSLPWGGLFDFRTDWASPHAGHRLGEEIDLDVPPPQLRARLEAALKGLFGFPVLGEDPSTKATHWHVRNRYTGAPAKPKAGDPARAFASVSCPTDVNRATVLVSPSVVDAGDAFQYAYRVQNPASSGQPLDAFVVLSGAPVQNVVDPQGWASVVTTQVDGSTAIGWFVLDATSQIASGTEVAGFGFTSAAAPGQGGYEVTTGSPVQTAVSEEEAEALAEDCAEVFEPIRGTVLAPGTVVDLDHDGLPDSWERRFGLNPLNGFGADGPEGDVDGDGLSNADEYGRGTDPTISNGPMVTITSPPATSTGPFITVTGTVVTNDADGLAGAIAAVTWSSDRGPSGSATGTTAWQADVPLFAGANVITVTATDAGGLTRTATFTVNVSSFVYSLAEGATGSFFTLDLLLGNPNAVAVPTTIQFLKEDGSVVTQNYTLSPTSRTTVRVNSIPGLESGAVSSVITSTNALPLLVERTMSWDVGWYGAHTETAVAGTNLTWYFAEGSQGFFDTYVLLANPNPTANSATVRFLTEGGGTVTKTYALLPNSRTNVYAGAIPELVGKSFGISVTFAQPAAAERAMYFGATPFWSGGHESAGVNAPATSWYHAEGATGAFFDTYILLSNPNSTPATVNVRFLPDSGVPVTKTLTLDANSRRTVQVASQHPTLANVAVATEVTSDIPIISERSMYWAGPFANWYEAHNAFGVTALATKWGLGEGRVGGPRGCETYILLANPGSTAATVTITYLRTNGTTLIRTYTVNSASRFTVGVNGLVPELLNEDFAAVITSTVPIAVERALYWNAGGVIWAAGTNATAIRLP